MDAGPGRLLGIDYGTKRVGLALSDPLRIVTRGGGTLENTPGLADAIAERVLEEQVVLVVVGMPFAPDGGPGAKGEEVGRFIELLRSRIAVPVEVWDESYTSVDARQAFIEGGMKKRKRREKGRVDEMAARLLLQGYMESTHNR